MPLVAFWFPTDTPQIIPPFNVLFCLLIFKWFIQSMAQASNREEKCHHLVDQRLPVPGKEDRHLLSLDLPIYFSHVQHLVLELLPLPSSKQSQEERGKLDQIKVQSRDSKSKPMGTIKHLNIWCTTSIKLQGQHPLVQSNPVSWPN